MTIDYEGVQGWDQRASSLLRRTRGIRVSPSLLPDPCGDNTPAANQHAVSLIPVGRRFTSVHCVRGVLTSPHELGQLLLTKELFGPTSRPPSFQFTTTMSQ